MWRTFYPSCSPFPLSTALCIVHEGLVAVVRPETDSLDNDGSCESLLANPNEGGRDGTRLPSLPTRGGRAQETLREIDEVRNPAGTVQS